MMRGQRTTGWHVFGSFSASKFPRTAAPSGRSSEDRNHQVRFWCFFIFPFGRRASHARAPDKKSAAEPKGPAALMPLQEPLSRS